MMQPPGPAGGQVGTSHDVIVPDADPAGRWALVCQARADTDGNGYVHFRLVEHGIVEGDEAALYLVRGSGLGERIRGMIARDRTGRWLVVARADGQVVLLDVELGTSIQLYPEISSVHEEMYPLAPSSIVFDPTGQRLLYRRRVRGRVVLVVRTLASGEERTIDPGPGKLVSELVSAGWLAGGEWLRIAAVHDDLNGDGRLEPPEDHRGTWAGTCGVGSTTYMAGRSEDVTLASVAWSTGLRVEGQFHQGFGEEVLIREQEAWFAVAPSGARRAMYVWEKCWPLHADATRGRIVADCGGEDETVLVAFAGKERRDIGRIGETVFDLQMPAPQILVMGWRWVLDLKTLRLSKVGNSVIAAHGSWALVWDRTAALLDVATGRRRRLRGPFYWGLQAGNGAYAYANPWLVDLERGRPLARLDRRVYAVASDGRLLVDTGDGALHWRVWQAAR